MTPRPPSQETLDRRAREFERRYNDAITLGHVPPPDIANRLRAARTRLGLRYVELERMIGVPRASLHGYETGKIPRHKKNRCALVTFLRWAEKEEAA